MEKGLKSTGAAQPKKKVWYWGRLIEERCPMCDTPMPFPFGCARCGWRSEDDETEKAKEESQDQ